MSGSEQPWYVAGCALIGLVDVSRSAAGRRSEWCCPTTAQNVDSDITECFGYSLPVSPEPSALPELGGNGGRPPTGPGIS